MYPLLNLIKCIVISPLLVTFKQSYFRGGFSFALSFPYELTKVVNSSCSGRCRGMVDHFAVVVWSAAIAGLFGSLTSPN